MIRDLAAPAGTTASLKVDRVDVCIIGAGIAGLVLAEKLRAHGRRVVVLESGGLTYDESIHELNTVAHLDRIHLGATDGRFRGLGGTSTRWGGQLLPLAVEDLAARPHVDLPAWPIEADALSKYLPEIEELFAVDDGPYDERFARASGAARSLPVGDPDLAVRFPKWPPFGRRNVATLLRDRIERDAGLEVWLNATATGFEVDREAELVVGVAAAHRASGRQLVARAANVVVAAGTIEATRILLLLDATHDGRIFADCEALGRYFQDHFSAPVARLAPTDPRRLNRTFGQRFVGTTMRSVRLELRPSAQTVEGVASAFGHISFETDEASGFALLRNFLRHRQEHRGLNLDLLAKLARQLPYFVAAGAWRYGPKQLRWPADAEFHLQVDVEQLPDRDNRITLCDERDRFGQRRAAIAWRMRPAELNTFAAYTRRFAAFWRRHRLDRLARIEWLIDPDRPDERVVTLGRDVYHPTGSTRMGMDGRGSVVDANLRTHAVANLWVASASVLPSSGSANPTLTLMLLARRLGDHLGKLCA